MMSMRANGSSSNLLRHPTVIVFVLGAISAVVSWGIRQEFVNINQQSQIDNLTHIEKQRLEPIEVARRLGNIEGRLSTLEKLLPSK